VGNDQANNPYLDEMLATYCELLYFERFHPDKVKWWWDFRVFTYSSQDFVDSTVYEFNGARPYINAIYLRGVQMLDAARKAIGDEAFFRWLYTYSEATRGKIATPQDFWGSLSTDEYNKLKTIRETYLQEPNILPEG
jgi:aminopeptidase N